MLSDYSCICLFVTRLHHTNALYDAGRPLQILWLFSFSCSSNKTFDDAVFLLLFFLYYILQTIKLSFSCNILNLLNHYFNCLFLLLLFSIFYYLNYSFYCIFCVLFLLLHHVDDQNQIETVLIASPFGLKKKTSTKSTCRPLACRTWLRHCLTGPVANQGGFPGYLLDTESRKHLTSFLASYRTTFQRFGGHEGGLSTRPGTFILPLLFSVSLYAANFRQQPLALASVTEAAAGRALLYSYYKGLWHVFTNI